MKKQFYLFKRGSVYCLQDGASGKQQSLKTKNRSEAERSWNAKNEAAFSPTLNVALAKAYLSSHDPKMLVRKWRDVFDEFCCHGQPQTQEFRKRKISSSCLDPIRDKTLIEKTAADLLSVLNDSGVTIKVPSLEEYEKAKPESF